MPHCDPSLQSADFNVREMILIRENTSTAWEPWLFVCACVCVCACEYVIHEPTHPSCHCMYRTALTVCTAFLTITNLLSSHTVYVCFFFVDLRSKIISLYSIDWLVFITEAECVYCAVPSTFYVLPTQCIYVFCVDLRTNSDYFTVQHWLVGFYIWDGVCLLSGTFYILRSAHTVYLCVLCGFQNKQRLFFCTALTGWFCITQMQCVYCAVRSTAESSSIVQFK
jgi:hypothetical protein